MSSINMKKKPYMLFVFFLAAALVFYLLSSKELSFNKISGEDFNIGNASIIANTSIPSVDSVPQHNMAVPESNKDIAGTTSELVWRPNDPALIAELNQWYEARGWFETMGGEVADDYRSYSREALLQLADTGDIRALQLLALRSSATEYKPLLDKAAIHGSIFALKMQANSLLAHSGITASSPQADKRQVLFEAAAYGEVAKIRGDLMTTGNSDVTYLEKTYNLNFSEEDRKSILARSQEIYADLEAQRISVGLGKFDNSIPPAVRAYFRAMGVLP